MNRLEMQHKAEADPYPKKNQQDEESGERDKHQVKKVGEN